MGFGTSDFGSTDFLWPNNNREVGGIHTESELWNRFSQNVVLELGMLLSRIGRDKVAILLSQAEDMERPSDIDGLLYIPFKDNVEEAKLSLAKEMQNNGYNLDIAKL